jgi:hypothetical protein
MAILINDVYLLVADLISKDKSGYVTNAEFNSRSKVAEQVLWGYRSKTFEDGGAVPDSLYPFMAETVLPITSGRVVIPVNYGRRLQMWWNKVANGDCGENPSLSSVAMEYLEKIEEANTLISSIRGPSIAKGNLYWALTGGQIRVYPESLSPSVRFEYLRYPTYGVRGVTLDVVNDQENYDAATTTNYEWDDDEQQNLIDLIMLQYGVSNRDSEVLQFAAQQSTINRTIIQNS